MISFEEATEIIAQYTETIEIEQIDFQQTLGRILAEDIRSDIDMPPFNKSAMDGYACRMSDIGNELEVLETIPAGQPPSKTIGKNQCSRIMTGSELPDGADCVIMVEHTKELENNKILFTAENSKPNFVPKGEDVRKGEIVLEKGTLIKPQHIAVMASVGCIKPLVYRKVRVGVLSTGDELVEPSVFPGTSRIRNSNAYQLVAQAERTECITEYYGIAKDRKDHSKIMIEKALLNSDVVLLTGGVSMGDFDFIPEVFKQIGIDIKFKSIAVQPGRPTVFGTNGNKYVFGLPGNPVSSFNIFELFVKPMLFNLMGYNYKPLNIKLPMGKKYSRKKSTRKSFLPVMIGDSGEVFPIEYHGSAHVHALVFADGLISIPIGKTELQKGELVDVRQI